MFASGIAPSLLFALLLIPILQSPRWLIERQREKQAREILEKIGGSEFAGAEFNKTQAALAQKQCTWGELFPPNCSRRCSSASRPCVAASNGRQRLSFSHLF